MRLFVHESIYNIIGVIYGNIVPGQGFQLPQPILVSPGNSVWIHANHGFRVSLQTKVTTTRKNNIVQS